MTVRACNKVALLEPRLSDFNVKIVVSYFDFFVKLNNAIFKKQKK